MKGRTGRIAATAIAVLLLLAGLGIFFYPTISDLWNSHVQSRMVVRYADAAASVTEEENLACLADAQAYNQALADAGSGWTLADPEYVDGYEDLLDITGSGIMGYITIDKIHVELPIYHGTSASVLSAGAGHLQGSSLPVGGESTHAVISAHRGLPSSRLFTNLDKLEVGDQFTITVLNTALTYEVDQIVTVLPNEMEELYIQPGEDLVTLVTCTPYGINDHRLLVRGRRVEEGQADLELGPLLIPVSRVKQCAAALLILVLLLTALLLTRRMSKKRKERRKNASWKTRRRERKEQAGYWPCLP